jgi:hypothetical protein
MAVGTVCCDPSLVRIPCNREDYREFVESSQHQLQPGSANSHWSSVILQSSASFATKTNRELTGDEQGRIRESAGTSLYQQVLSSRESASWNHMSSDVGVSTGIPARRNKSRLTEERTASGADQLPHKLRLSGAPRD